jgi:hypothetical protein
MNAISTSALVKWFGAVAYQHPQTGSFFLGSPVHESIDNLVTTAYQASAGISQLACLMFCLQPMMGPQFWSRWKFKIR